LCGNTAVVIGLYFRGATTHFYLLNTVCDL